MQRKPESWRRWRGERRKVGCSSVILRDLVLYDKLRPGGFIDAKTIVFALSGKPRKLQRSWTKRESEDLLEGWKRRRPQKW